MTYDWACSIWLRWPVFVYSTFWYITYRQTTQNRNKYRSNEKQNTWKTILGEIVFSVSCIVVTQQLWKIGGTVYQFQYIFFDLVPYNQKLTKICPKLRVNGFQLQATALSALQSLQQWMNRQLDYIHTLNSLLPYVYLLKLTAKWILFIDFYLFFFKVTEGIFVSLYFGTSFVAPVLFKILLKKLWLPGMVHIDQHFFVTFYLQFHHCFSRFSSECVLKIPNNLH